MIKRLKRRSTIIFSILNISVLLFVIVFAFGNSKKQVEQSEVGLSRNNINNFIDTISITGEARQSELDALIQEHNLHLYLEDNGTPLVLSQNFNQKIVVQTKEIAASYGVFLDDPSQSQMLTTDFLISLQKKNDIRVIIQQALGKNNQWITAIGFQSRIEEERKIQSIVRFYAIVTIVSSVVFAFISRVLAELSAKPTEKSLQMQNDFIAAASHEIRTPLAVIKANMAAMKLQPGRHRYYSDVIDGEITVMARLADDLTNLANHAKAKWTLTKGKTNIDTLLISLYETFLPLVKKKNQELHLKLPEQALPEIDADEERLRQVFAILLSNAATYTDQNSLIVLGASLGEKSIVLSVSDNGDGIPKRESGKIFQPFYRMDASRSDKNHFGLGLSIAKDIVELHNGSIVYRDTKGGGATFEITLPLFYKT